MADGATPPADDTVRVQAEENPVEDGPDGTAGAEVGPKEILFRIGDRLAYKGDKWEAAIRDEPERAPPPPPPEVFVGSFTLGDWRVPWDMHEWAPRERRGGSLVAAGVASLLVVLGIAAQFVFPSATWLLTLLLVGLVVALAFQLAVFLTAEPPAEPVGGSEVAAGGAAAAQPEPETVEPPTVDEPDHEPSQGPEPLDVLTLKCSECGEVFDVEDHGERPLTHTCPGCGSDGEIPTDELPDPADLREEDEPASPDDEDLDAPAGDIPEEAGDPIPEFDLDDEED